MNNDTVMLLALGVGAYFLLKGQGGGSQQQQQQPQPTSSPTNFWDFAGSVVTTVGDNLGNWLNS